MIKSYGEHVSGVNMYLFYIPLLSSDAAESKIALSMPWEFEILGLRVYRRTTKGSEPIALRAQEEPVEPEFGRHQESSGPDIGRQGSSESTFGREEPEPEFGREESRREVEAREERPTLSYDLLVNGVSVLTQPVEVLEEEFNDAEVIEGRYIPADSVLTALPLPVGESEVFNDITLTLCLRRR